MLIDSTLQLGDQTAILVIGSYRAMATKTFPLHSVFLHEDWKKPVESWLSADNMEEIVPFPKEFVDKWPRPTAEAPVICLNNHNTNQVHDVLTFNNVTDFHLDSILGCHFELSGITVSALLAVNALYTRPFFLSE